MSLNKLNTKIERKFNRTSTMKKIITSKKILERIKIINKVHKLRKEPSKI